MNLFSRIPTLYALRDLIWDYPVFFVSIYRRARVPSIIVVLALSLTYLYSNLSYPVLSQSSFLNAGSSNSIYTEGILGQIGTYNPMILTGSDVDRGLYNLIYTKLIDISPTGEPLPSLALSWEERDSGKEIRFILSDGYYWHDGQRVTVDDVIYTFTRAMELADTGVDTFGSSFRGVQISSDADNTVIFTFDEKVAAVYESLSVHIVPKHLFSNLSIAETLDYGRLINPVGSGIFRVVRKSPQMIEMRSWDMHIDKPSVTTFRYRFFRDLESLSVAFRNNLLDAIGNVETDDLPYLSEYKNYRSASISITNRKKMLYMNLRDERFQNVELRRAISQSIDKARLVDQLSFAFKPTGSSVSSVSWAYFAGADDIFSYDKKTVLSSLDSLGYTYTSEEDKYRVNSVGDILEFEIVFLDNKDNIRLVTLLEEMFGEVGVRIRPVPVSFDRLVNEVLATRDFEMLISQVEVTSDPDQYNLWHSTKVNYPDLNIAGYEYNRLDVLLEDARRETSLENRKVDYLQIQRFIAQDVPAISLYEPSYSFVISNRFQNIRLYDANFPYERYWNISEWEIR